MTPDLTAAGTSDLLRPTGRPLVGREPELREIGRALEEARAGRGQLLLLSGEPGVGKTRLCDEAATLAAAHGTPVSWGRAWEAGGAPAYWPWLEILDRLARALDDQALREALGDGASLIAEIVPSVRARLGALAATATPSADEGRFRIWRAVSALVRQSSEAPGPVQGQGQGQGPAQGLPSGQVQAQPPGQLIVLEDLHAADEASLRLLHFVARALRGTRTLILGTYRDVEAHLDPSAGEALARVRREGTRLAVRRLDRDATATFLRLRAGAQASAQASAIDPAIADRIFASTQGNPLFLEEMARVHDEEGAAAIAAGALPQGVRDVIRQRLDRVPANARPLLDMAAVAGDEIDIALLAAVAGTSADAIGEALAGAVRAGVLVERGGDRLRFYHALVREVLYRQIDPPRRRLLHGQVHAALAALHGARPAPPLAELAHHALEGPATGIDGAVEVAIRAATRALDLQAHEEAVALLARATAAVERAGNPPVLRARVLLALARARLRRGEVPAGRALCIEAAALVRAGAWPDLLAECALIYGEVFTPSLVDPALVGLLEEAVAAQPPGDSGVRVRLLARLAGALTPAVRTAEPVQVAREAIAAARRLGDRATLLGALYAGMSAFMDIVGARERLALNLEIEQLASTTDDRERLMRTQARLVVDHAELGEWAAAEARVQAFETLAHELHAPWVLWRASLFRSMSAIARGHFAEAERLVAGAAEPARASGDPEAERCWIFHREGLLRAWERHDEMRTFDAIARRARAVIHRAAGVQAAVSALVAARREDREGTRLHLDLAPPEMRPPFDNPYGVFFTAEAAAFAGDDAVAATCYAMLEPAAERDVIMGMSALLWEGPVARLLALLAAQLGRWPAAVAHFDAALARIEAVEARPYRARTRYEYGRALIARGRDADRARARTLIAQARDEAEALGQTGLVRLADERLATLGVGMLGEFAAAVSSSSLPATTTATATAVTPATAPAATPAFVLEGESWVVAHGGQTARFKDSLGFHYLARLVAEPDREVHVLDLVRARGGEPADPGEVVDRGDAGELIDREAHESYRARLADLRDTVAEAESFADAARAARARAEIEALAHELGRAVGLGGRTRRAASAAERARSAVQRRIRNAIARIGEHAPALAAHLTRAIRTGVTCVYRSTPATPPASPFDPRED